MSLFLLKIVIEQQILVSPKTSYLVTYPRKERRNTTTQRFKTAFINYFSQVLLFLRLTSSSLEEVLEWPHSPSGPAYSNYTVMDPKPPRGFGRKFGLVQGVLPECRRLCPRCSKLPNHHLTDVPKGSEGETNASRKKLFSPNIHQLQPQMPLRHHHRHHCYRPMAAAVYLVAWRVRKQSLLLIQIFQWIRLVCL